MLTLSATPDFTPFGELMISPIRYIHSRFCQCYDYAYGLRSLVCLPGLVGTALSRTYFIPFTPDIDTSSFAK